MYAAKRAGKNQFAVYREAMRQLILGRHRLAADLELALRRQQLDVHYQPITTIDGRFVHGVEALIRWNHPELGAVAPVDLRAAAEGARLLTQVDEFVLGPATRHLAAWQAQLPQAAGLLIGVNASAETFRVPGLTDRVRSALRQADLDTSRLVLEVTERTLIERQPRVERNFRELVEAGVGSVPG